MKLKKFAVAVIFSISTLAYAQSLSQADRDKALQYLESTKQGVIDATQGLTPDQWNFKQAPDRWSVAEVTEHIAAAEDFLFDNITNNVMKAPARTEADDVKSIDDMVLAKVPDRTNKVKAPEPLRPTNRYGSPEASLKHFLESRERTIEYLKKTDDLRAHAADGPFGKKMDGYEWILFIAGHSDRHTKQIKEVEADAKFPK